MAKKNLIGAWAFLLGVILAIIVGLFGVSNNLIATILIILGIVIGLLNIGGTELKDFMLAGTVLVIAGALGGQTLLNVAYIGDILQSLVVLFVPATIVVALKSVFALARR